MRRRSVLHNRRNESHALRLLARSELCLIFLLIALPQNRPISDGAPDNPLTFTLRYANNSGASKQCSLIVDGAPAGTQTFPATGGKYQTVTLNVNLINTIQLLVADTDVAANGGAANLSLDVLELSRGPSFYLLEAEHATFQGVSAAADTNASSQQAVVQFGHAVNDSIQFTVSSTPIDDPNFKMIYSWDQMNRLTGIQHFNSSGILKQSGAWNYQGGIGWQLSTQTIGAEQRSYTYGFGGEVLSEQIPSVGLFQGASRTYVNGGVDRVLWTHDNDTAAPPNYFLNDTNGGVYGITDSNGGMIERQRFGAFGTTVLTQPNGAKQPVSQTGNRMGYQGLSDLMEFGAFSARNRIGDDGTGRLLSADPLGLSGGDRYSWCGGDPVNGSDPMGLWDLRGSQLHPIPQPPPPKPADEAQMLKNVGKVAIVAVVSYFSAGSGTAFATVIGGGLNVGISKAVQFATQLKVPAAPPAAPAETGLQSTITINDAASSFETNLSELKSSYRGGKITIGEFAEQHQSLFSNEYPGMEAMQRDPNPVNQTKAGIADSLEESGLTIKEPSSRSGMIGGQKPSTRAQIERLAKLFTDRKWEIVGGAQDIPKEVEFPGYGGGKLGSVRADLTVRNPATGKTIYINTIDRPGTWRYSAEEIPALERAKDLHDITIIPILKPRVQE